MATPAIRWRRVTVSERESPALRSLAMAAPPDAANADIAAAAFGSGAAASAMELALPDLSEYAAPLAKARFLLDTAAEIEHALMVQYLYAAYSLKDSSDGTLTEGQQKAVQDWKDKIVEIATEEMGHLMTVQNLLLFVRQPPNFEREDFPPRKQLYPFPMNLERLGPVSLARYIVAESPPSATGLEEVVRLATQGGATQINHVGVLYAVLGVIFSRHEDLEANAARGPWFQAVYEMAQRLYREFPEMSIDEWHLRDVDLDPASHARQAPGGSWSSGAIRVFDVATRERCLVALEDISVQGEGMSAAPGTTPQPSHFERFLAIFKGEGQLPFPLQGEWNPTREVPLNPFVDPDSTDVNAISNESTGDWARLANLRYATLLAVLQHYFPADETLRTALVTWSFSGGMRPLKDLSDILTKLPRAAVADIVAALPFGLPDVINLPAEPESQNALIRRRLRRSLAIIQGLEAAGNMQPVLRRMKTADRSLLLKLGETLTADEQPDDEPVAPPVDSPVDGPTPQEQALLGLLDSRQPEAAARHAGIPTGAVSLRQLFRDKNYPAILAFLRSGNAIRAPFAGKPLVVPGKPEESAVYLQMSDPDGVMSGEFSDEELQVVRDWIQSLADSGTTPVAPSTNEPAVEVDRWAQVATVKIHPAIGVARVGNAGFIDGAPSFPASADDYFIGPERPYEASPPAGGYKRNGKVRRQAARFRLYGYDADGKLIGEITAAEASITWTVELANRKAAFRRFEGLTSTSEPRNAHVPEANRGTLEITPGPRSLDGPNQAAAFDHGSFTGWRGASPRRIDGIYLGEIHTDAEGRLVVLGGEGSARSPWNEPVTNYANNDGWFDTTSDGPVTAKVVFGSREVKVKSAWVLCGPPKFAPALRNIVTLYDMLTQRAIDKGWKTVPDQPSFRFDILPVMQRAVETQWVFQEAEAVHVPLSAASSASPAVRAKIFGRLRPPGPAGGGPKQNMPQLLDDSNRWSRQGPGGLAVTPTMYELLRLWSIGQFKDDSSEGPPTPPMEITPEGLDQAALENCAGGAFFPGIEAGWMLRDVVQLVEPYRLDGTGLRAGDITRQMAVPWQADFRDCAAEQHDGRIVPWWPQQRPITVQERTSEDYQNWTRGKVGSRMDMVRRWFELGFIVAEGDRYVETERNP